LVISTSMVQIYVNEGMLRSLPSTFQKHSSDGRGERADGVGCVCDRLNRIGNLLVPNSNYCAFEDWVVPILDTMLEEQEKEGMKWSPSSVINRLGKEIDNEDSVYYWCYKVSLIPIRRTPLFICAPFVIYCDRHHSTLYLYGLGRVFITDLYRTISQYSAPRSQTVPSAICSTSTPTSLPPFNSV
jgi:hypothetical protein